MLLVVLVVSILLAIGAFILVRWADKKGYDAGVEFTILFAISLVLFVGSLGGIIFNGCQVQESFVVQDRIDMYQEQNDKIEADMSEMVQSYMQYEGQTFKEVTKDNAMQLIQLYPNLKSNELVVNNMNLHQENIKTINKLKDEQIHYKIARWWLYFGN